MLNAIKKARLTAGITQIDLAEKMGVTNGAIALWEKGITRPRPARLKKLASVLGTSVDYLMSDWEEE